MKKRIERLEQLAQRALTKREPQPEARAPLYGRRADDNYDQLGLSVRKDLKERLRHAAIDLDVTMSELLDEILLDAFSPASPTALQGRLRHEDLRGFLDGATGNDAALLCPGCGEPWLHHHNIAAWDRDDEDSKTGLYVNVGAGVSVEGAPARNGLFVAREMTGNPSRRRDGLVVRFWCETCDARPVLRLVQHKGETFITWGTEAGGEA